MMADSKLSALTALAGASLATADELYVRDESEAASAESKRITAEDLAVGLAPLIHQTTILSNSGNQTITTATFEVMELDTEVLDELAIGDVANDRATFTAAGLYLCYATVGFQTSAGGDRRFLACRHLNSSDVLQTQTRIEVGPYSATMNPSLQAVLLVNAAVGDYVEGQLYQDSGGNLVSVAAKQRLYITRLA
jgi:hypothetical protein